MTTLKELLTQHGQTLAGLADVLGGGVRSVIQVDARGLPDRPALAGRPRKVTVQSLAAALSVTEQEIRHALQKQVKAWRRENPQLSRVDAERLEGARLARRTKREAIEGALCARRAGASTRAARGQRFAAHVGALGVSFTEAGRRLGVTRSCMYRLRVAGFRREGEGAQGISAEQIEVALGMAPGCLTAGESPQG